MKLLCISNGHGEDGIAVQILEQLRALPQAPEIAAMPIVGEGGTYRRAGFPIVGPTQAMPSGGFVYMDRKQLAKDVQSGLLTLTWKQFQTLRAWAKTGGAVFAVGDIVPLAMAWLSGAPYGFIGTAKSEYFLRDESGPLSSRSRYELAAGSVYWPWERWLMASRRCRAVFVRDQLTADFLRKFKVDALYSGNPMMDHLEPHPEILARVTTGMASMALKLLLMPGSRVPEAHANWQQILQALAGVLTVYPDKPVGSWAAIAPSLDLQPFDAALRAADWQPITTDPYLTYQQGNHRLRLTQDAYGECLHTCEAAMAMAGTATEQFVGLGKPAFTFPGEGPQFTPIFADAQARLLGRSIILLSQPDEVGTALWDCLQDSDRLQAIRANGLARMGQPGAAERIARLLSDRLPS